jgi:hypothetical protein
MEKFELTFGQKLVGLELVSVSNNVEKAKMLFAAAADLLKNEYVAKNLGGHPDKEMLYTHAIGEILNAQMNTVKVLTLSE